MAEVDAVQATIDIERSCETPWSARQLAQIVNAAIPLHRVYAVRRFKRPDQVGESSAAAAAPAVRALTPVPAELGR